ncbi:unnamed protein product [Kuraishia capsulata CBS 1993]|uniref:Copper-fist domain-containing protein n=1 Tax=Kuraishia capsulata CBS 1993 TaxID=1382522 RepID=W6ML41_9ASCO|nr:uncharacterized protein KUCA_T00003171001 [Kuraishia capsulata CBS 1993]CDK27194.1 unnamed protein product [Kuraishia capsulata CBS 1993]
MILVEGEKYACVRCIRGHRSSTCQHTQRTLVLVRSKGRPDKNNKNRVAITAAQIEDSASHDTSTSRVDSCCSGKVNTPVITPKTSCCHKDIYIKHEEGSCCREKKSPNPSAGDSKVEGQNVIVLKATRKQVFNAAKGSFRLLDPVGELNPKTTAGITKSHKGCACCKNSTSQNLSEKFKNMDVSSFDVKRSSSSPNIRLNEDSNQLHSMSEGFTTPVKLEHSLISENRNNITSTTFDMYLCKPCSVPGSCLCQDSDCACDNCFVHNKSPNSMASSLGAPIASIQMQSYNNPNDADSSSYQPSVQGFTLPDSEECSCQEDECSCFQCGIHGIKDGIRVKDGLKVCDPPSPSWKDEYANVFSMLQQKYTPNSTEAVDPNNIFVQLGLDEMENDCCCPDDACDCLTCFKHGRFGEPDILNFTSNETY